MKFLLAALNAKYIHSNLAVHTLKAYGDMRLDCQEMGDWEIEVAEYTINQDPGEVLKDIFLRKPQVVGFSCYIWNIARTLELVRDLPKVLPGVEIWLGGPEASHQAGELVQAERGLRGIMAGEGEETFAQLLGCYALACHDHGFRFHAGWEQALGKVNGIVFSTGEGEVRKTPAPKPVHMDQIPFPYGSLWDFQHRIIYYESSRGCPFSCSYCLSSLDKSVRFRSLDLVKEELAFFLDQGAKQVKFVDRTFNCKKSHALEIWRFIQEKDNGSTNFHFEIAADLLDDEELELLGRMRPGLVQLEIGVQTTNPLAIKEIRRTTDLGRLKEAVARIRRGRNIHQHLDLIVGLPYEDYASFARSFDDVFAMGPDQLQMGFLKVLKGSYMAQMAQAYGLLCQEAPPYQVLSTRWLSYGQVARLQAVEEMVEVYYNSGQFTSTLPELLKEFQASFHMFEALADYYQSQGLLGISHSRMARYEILDRFIREGPGRGNGGKVEKFRELLIYDMYLRENLKSRPSFAGDLGRYKKEIKEFFAREAESPKYLMGYEGYDARQMAKMAHLEVLGGGRALLFDYQDRDPLSHNGRAWEIRL